MLERPSSPAVDWNTLRSEGGNLSLAFQTGKPRHIVVIPEEVLEDGLGSWGQEPKADAVANKTQVEDAIKKAFSVGDWQELIEIHSGTKLFQLWISRSHFERF